MQFHNAPPLSVPLPYTATSSFLLLAMGSKESTAKEQKQNKIPRSKWLWFSLKNALCSVFYLQLKIFSSNTAQM